MSCKYKIKLLNCLLIKLFILLISLSCVHYRQPSASFQGSVSHWFIRSKAADGGTILRILKDGHTLYRFEGDWILDAHKKLKLEFYTPLGNTALSLQASDNLLKVVGNNHFKHSLSLNKNHNIVFQGWNSQLKVIDFTCLLQGKMPKTWLEKITYVRSTKTSKVAISTVDQKDIKITFEINKVCFDNSSYFLGFWRRNGVKACLAADQSVMLDLINGYQIQILADSSESDSK